MTREIILKGVTVKYELQRKNVKNLNLRIKADRTVYISANSSISESMIEEFISSKAEYILNALNKYEEMAKYAPKPKSYVDGESFQILGHQLRLRVVHGKTNTVSSDGSYITLTIKDTDDFELKKKTMDKWIKKLCEEIVVALCETIYPKFQKYGIDFPQIRFRNMISRWGSCQPKRGILTFNVFLIEAPLACIEYVVVHEFTHFLQPNHSKRFYMWLAMLMPDWKDRKNLLEKNVFSYYM